MEKIRLFCVAALCVLCAALPGCNNNGSSITPGPGVSTSIVPTPGTSSFNRPGVCRIIVSSEFGNIGAFYGGWLSAVQIERFASDAKEYVTIDIYSPESLELLEQSDIRHLDNKVYEDMVKRVLEENGLLDVPAAIKQIYRFDFDGDGKEEVLIAAENYESLVVGTVKNTYSFILLCSEVNGEWKSSIAGIGEFYYEDVEHPHGVGSISYEIVSFIDGEGDGSYQPVVSYKHYSASTYSDTARPGGGILLFSRLYNGRFYFAVQR